MAVETIVRYITSDGKQFDDHDAAVKHDDKLIADREAKEGKLRRRMELLLKSKTLDEVSGDWPKVLHIDTGNGNPHIVLLKNKEALGQACLRLLQHRYNEDLYSDQEDQMKTVEFILNHWSAVAAYDFLLDRCRFEDEMIEVKNLTKLG